MMRQPGIALPGLLGGVLVALAAAAATARIRPRLAVSVAAVPPAVSGGAGEGDPAPGIALPRAAGPADHGPSWRRATYLLLLFAVAVAALSGLALGMLSS